MRFLMALAMLTLLVFGTWQIFTRWILGNPSTFTDELLRYVLIIAGFIGSAYCFYRDEHLALTLITDKAKGPFKLCLDIFIEICILFFVIYVFIFGRHAHPDEDPVHDRARLRHSDRACPYSQVCEPVQRKERREQIMVVTATIVLFVSFFVMLLAGVPISAGIGIASVIAICASGRSDFQGFAFTAAQKCFSGLDSFSLLALPFFSLGGNIMNKGGIAKRLVRLARLLVGGIPGYLAATNVLANMFFGAVSGSSVAATSAMGSILSPLEADEGYDPNYSAAVNICSAPTGILIPPSGPLILYSITAGGVSVAALFMGGYFVGAILGICVAVVAMASALPSSPSPWLSGRATRSPRSRTPTPPGKSGWTRSRPCSRSSSSWAASWPVSSPRLRLALSCASTAASSPSFTVRWTSRPSITSWLTP